MTREEKLDFIYRHAHPDQRCRMKNGERAVLILEGEVTKLCPLFLLPDRVVEERYNATKLRLEAAEWSRLQRLPVLADDLIQG